jgi:hypothetical protein
MENMSSKKAFKLALAAGLGWGLAQGALAIGMLIVELCLRGLMS